MLVKVYLIVNSDLFYKVKLVCSRKEILTSKCIVQIVLSKVGSKINQKEIVKYGLFENINGIQRLINESEIIIGHGGIRSSKLIIREMSSIEAKLTESRSKQSETGLAMKMTNISKTKQYKQKILKSSQSPLCRSRLLINSQLLSISHQKSVEIIDKVYFEINEDSHQIKQNIKQTCIEKSTFTYTLITNTS
jgi:hypothetical protein